MTTDVGTAVITGANKGLGYFTAEGLAQKGYRVVLVGRRPERLDVAQQTLMRRVPGAKVLTGVADFASLGGARTGARALRDAGISQVDVLVNNAGIVHAPRTRHTTGDGLELVMATNLIGHVAWTDEIFHVLAPSARIVWLGSMASKIWDSKLTDFYCENPYKPWRAYTQSKIAVQVFGYELARRFRAAGSSMSSIVADPGYSLGGLTIRVPGINNPKFRKGLREIVQIPFAQGKHTGAAPIVHAASAPGVENGDALGPKWWTKGAPVRRTLSRTSTDPRTGLRVWDQAVSDAEATNLAALLPN